MSNSEKKFTLDAKFDQERFSAMVKNAIDECITFCKSDNEDEDEYDPHTVAEAMCWKCGARWIAAFPSATLLKELECPGCHNAGHAFLTGQDIAEDG